jgi:hypothetical protein
MIAVPTLMNDTTFPLMETTEGVEVLNVTASPEVEVAVGVYVAPPTTALEGATDVNEIVCVSPWPKAT